MPPLSFHCVLIPPLDSVCSIGWHRVILLQQPTLHEVYVSPADRFGVSLIEEFAERMFAGVMHVTVLSITILD